MENIGEPLDSQVRPRVAVKTKSQTVSNHEFRRDSQKAQPALTDPVNPRNEVDAVGSLLDLPGLDEAGSAQLCSERNLKQTEANFGTESFSLGSHC